MVGSRPARAVRGGGRARNSIFAQGPLGQAPKGMPCEPRSGPARPVVGVRAERAWLAVPAGRRMRFPCKDPMEREWARRAGMVGFGPDATAGGCGGARNAISRSDPMQSGADQQRRAGRGSDRDGTAGDCGGGRNSIFAHRPSATWGGPATPEWPGSDRMRRLAVAAEHGMRFSCKDPMSRALGGVVAARASSIPALIRKLTPALRSSTSARVRPSAKGHGPPNANTMTCRACHRALRRDNQRENARQSR
jgi:hypothetical protein